MPPADTRHLGCQSRMGFLAHFLLLLHGVFRVAALVVSARACLVAGKLEVLSELVEPIVQSLGCVLWGIEFVSQGRQTQLRVFIDKESGIGLEDCEAVSRQFSAVLDVEDPIAGEYTLEVSSPGLDRPLFTLEQYADLAGNQVNMRLRVPFEGRRKYRGVIQGVEGDEVVIVCEDHEYLFPFDTIEKANVIPQF